MSARPRLFTPIRFFSILALVVVFFTSILSAQSSPVFNGPRDYPVGTSPNSMVVGDFNGDGRPDIATANHGSNNISVLLQNRDGTFQAAVNYAVGNGPLSLQVGDVNCDGKLDLVLCPAGSSIGANRSWTFIAVACAVLHGLLRFFCTRAQAKNRICISLRLAAGYHHFNCN
jgi:hypothetical protein